MLHIHLHIHLQIEAAVAATVSPHEAGARTAARYEHRRLTAADGGVGYEQSDVGR